MVDLSIKGHAYVTFFGRTKGAAACTIALQYSTLHGTLKKAYITPRWSVMSDTDEQRYLNSHF